MDSTDYEILKGQLATKIGRAVAEFVKETDSEALVVTVAVDKPVACFDEDGNGQGVKSIRVYITEGDDDGEEL